MAWLGSGCSSGNDLYSGEFEGPSRDRGGSTNLAGAGGPARVQAGSSGDSANQQSGIAGRRVGDDDDATGGATDAGSSGGGTGPTIAGTGGFGGVRSSAGGSVTSVGSTSGGRANAGSAGLNGGRGGLGGGGENSAGGGGKAATLCGNGRIDTGETCDSGRLVIGESDTSGESDGAAAAGGTGGVSIVATYGQLCSNTCYEVGTQQCLDCESGYPCSATVNNCLGSGDQLFDAAEQAACYAVMRCIQESNCFDGTASPGKCYCGDLPTQQCSGAPFIGDGSPNGACAAEIRAGFPTLTNTAQVLGNLQVLQFPSGAAMNRLSCQKLAKPSNCGDVCGFTVGGPGFP